MLDTSEITVVMEKLEGLDDEALAVSLLKEFNDKTGRLGVLLQNLDPALSHEEWKKLCDQAKTQVDQVIAKIMAL